MLDRLEFDPPGIESSDNAQRKKKSLRSRLIHRINPFHFDITSITFF